MRNGGYHARIKLAWQGMRVEVQRGDWLLADNPFVKGEGLSQKPRRELLGHSRMTLGLQLVLTTSRKTIFSPI